MTVVLVCLNPKQPFPSMLDLGLIAHPGRPWQQDISLQDIEERKE
jgi:hypothetical protein